MTMSSRYRTRLQDVVDDIPAMRRIVQVKLRQIPHRAEVEACLDKLETFDADGRAMYPRLRLHAAEPQAR
jgi:hypothetical protein